MRSLRDDTDLSIVSLTPEEKLGFDRFVEELQVAHSDKPNCSDFNALANVSIELRFERPTSWF